jgi:type IV secretion system protein VirD4
MRVSIVLSAALALASSFALATAFIAQVFGPQAALGNPLWTIGERAFYAPWAVLDWSARFADAYPKPFAVAQLILLGGFVAAALVLALGLRGKAKPKPFGQEAWGGFKDAEAAGLFADAGAVLGKLDGEILCFDGPEHQLLIGASRSGKGRGHVVPTLLAWPRSAPLRRVRRSRFRMARIPGAKPQQHFC